MFVLVSNALTHIIFCLSRVQEVCFCTRMQEVTSKKMMFAATDLTVSLFAR